MLISTDEKLVLSTVIHLEKQLAKVDELLENLQEEEWKDEEEGLLDHDGDHWRNDEHDFDDNNDDDDEGGDRNEEKPEETSVLHQILAMVLGAMPHDEKRMTQEEHFSYLKRQHATIVQGWKDEFGRLPQLNYEDRHPDTESRDREGEVDNEEDLPVGLEPMMDVGWDEDRQHLDLKMKNMSLASDAQTSTEASTFNAPLDTGIFGPSSVPDDWEDAVDDTTDLDLFDDFFRPMPVAPMADTNPVDSSPHDTDAIHVPRTSPPPPAPVRTGLRPGGRMQ